MTATVARTAPPAPFRFACPACPFLVRVVGDCMEPVIADGDSVRVDPAIAPKEGAYVMFEHVECGLLLKQFRVERDGAALVALNADIRFPVDASVRIIGVVTHVQRWLVDPREYFRRRAPEPCRPSRRAEKRRAPRLGRAPRRLGGVRRSVPHPARRRAVPRRAVRHTRQNGASA